MNELKKNKEKCQWYRNGHTTAYYVWELSCLVNGKSYITNEMTWTRYTPGYCFQGGREGLKGEFSDMRICPKCKREIEVMGYEDFKIEDLDEVESEQKQT